MLKNRSALQTLLSSFEQVAVSLIIKQLIQLLARADMAWLSRAQTAATPEVSRHYYDAVRDLTLYRNHIELRFTENLHREFSQLNAFALGKSADKQSNASTLSTSPTLTGIIGSAIAPGIALPPASLQSSATAPGNCSQQLLAAKPYNAMDGAYAENAGAIFCPPAPLQSSAIAPGIALTPPSPESPELVSTYTTLCNRLSSLGVPQVYLHDFPLLPKALERLFTEIIDSVDIDSKVKITVTETFSDGLVPYLHSTYQQLAAVLDAAPQTPQTRLHPTGSKRTTLRSPASGSIIPVAASPEPSLLKKIYGPSASQEWTGIENNLTLEEYEQHLHSLALKLDASPKSHSDALTRSFEKMAASGTERALKPTREPPIACSDASRDGGGRAMPDSREGGVRVAPGAATEGAIADDRDAALNSNEQPYPYLELIQTLKPGDWIEIARTNKWIRMRLSFLSKKTASYFFVDERRGQFMQKTEAALLAGLKNQEITLVGKMLKFDPSSPLTASSTISAQAFSAPSLESLATAPSVAAPGATLTPASLQSGVSLNPAPASEFD